MWDSKSFVNAYDADVNKFWEPVAVLKYATKMPVKKAGSYLYSDTNYLLLGLLLEKKTGKEVVVAGLHPLVLVVSTGKLTLGSTACASTIGIPLHQHFNQVFYQPLGVCIVIVLIFPYDVGVAIDPYDPPAVLIRYEGHVHELS